MDENYAHIKYKRGEILDQECNERSTRKPGKWQRVMSVRDVTKVDLSSLQNVTMSPGSLYLRDGSANEVHGALE